MTLSLKLLYGSIYIADESKEKNVSKKKMCKNILNVYKKCLLKVKTFVVNGWVSSYLDINSYNIH